MYPALFLISLIASTIGAICGIGGGVIIKPSIDILGITDVSSASLLSSCTVLMMTGYSVVKEFSSKTHNRIDKKNVFPLAVGAACGGLAGKISFELIKSSLPFTEMVGAYQAVLLGIVALGTFLYTNNKSVIKTKKIDNSYVSFVFGLFLGAMSSFLGIGGGPIDLVVLFYFFSMDTKTASQNALFIIFISQLFSILYTCISGKIPDVQLGEILIMVVGGFLGGVIGKRINSSIRSEIIDKLFMGVLLVIILMSIYNFFHYYFG